LADEADDLFLVVGALGIEDDLLGVILGALDAVLVYHPLQGAAVAEAVVGDFGGKPSKVSQAL